MLLSTPTRVKMRRVRRAASSDETVKKAESPRHEMRGTRSSEGEVSDVEAGVEADEDVAADLPTDP